MLTDPNYKHKPLRDYSLSLGESLTKFGRHQLCLLCVDAINDELKRRPIPNKSKGRGRPLSPVSILARRMGVHPDSVRRWMDLREIQASDYNSEKLAAMAITFNPEGVTRILRMDLRRYRETMEAWLKRVAPDYIVSPYAENTGVEDGD